MMTAELYFENVKKFLETKPASQKLMDHLNSNVEIGIYFSSSFECTYFKQENKPKFENRTPKSPDVIFHLTPESIEALLKAEGTDLSELVGDVAKLYLAGAIKISLPGPLPRLLMKGYLRVIKESHAKLLQVLKDHGLRSLTFPAIIEKLKSMK